MSKTKQILIIGGGVSGLAAGVFLSKKGYQVKLFEANDKIGGAAATTTVDGYSFNDGAMYVALPRMLNHVFEKLGIDRPASLPWQRIVSQTTSLPDGTAVTMRNGSDLIIENQLGNTNDTNSQQDLQQLMQRWEPVLRLFEDDIMLHPLSLTRAVMKGWRHLPKLRGTVASELKSLVRDESVRAAISGALLFAGVPPEKLPVFSILGLVSMLKDGLYLPEGGMGRIPDVLAYAFTQNGGEIFLNSDVKQISVKNGRVYAVDIAGYEVVETDTVISTVGGMTTFSKLINPENISRKMSRKVETSPLSHKALNVQLGLTNCIDVSSHLNSFLPLMKEQRQVFMPDTGTKWPSYSVPTVTMPDLAPSGGSIVEVFIPCTHNDLIDSWTDIRKEEMGGEVISTLSRLHKIDIAVKRVRSPKDFRDQMHCFQGALYGLSPAAEPRSQFAHKSPISGLYLAGQTTFPGYGIPTSMVSGILAAEAVIGNKR